SFLTCSADHRDLHSFPTRRSSDLRRVHALAAELELEARHAEERAGRCTDLRGEVGQRGEVVPGPRRLGRELLTRELHAIARVAGDRKSTRLNSSHDQISYAVFCLK